MEREDFMSLIKALDTLTLEMAAWRAALVVKVKPAKVEEEVEPVDAEVYILDALHKYGPMSVRDITRNIRPFKYQGAAKVVSDALDCLRRDGKVMTVRRGKATVYRVTGQ